jgi:hypothetical protein
MRLFTRLELAALWIITFGTWFLSLPAHYNSSFIQSCLSLIAACFIVHHFGTTIKMKDAHCPHEEAIEQAMDLLKNYRLNQLDGDGTAWLIGFCEGFKEELEQDYAPRFIRGPMTENRKRHRQLIQDYLDLKMTLAEFDAASKDIPVDWI